jgi:superfamily I DNA and/or RNA helicase
LSAGVHNPKDFYAFFRDCYKLDNKEFVVDNLLAQKYPYKWFVARTEELIHDELPIIPYGNKKAEALEKEIALYKLEKKLFYACFFVLGKNDNPLRKDQRFCAPLVLFPATIQTRDGSKFLTIDKGEYFINRAAISRLQIREDTGAKDVFLQELEKRLSGERAGLLGLKRIFEKHFSNIDAEELLLFPKVWSATKIRKHLTEDEYGESNFKIVPAAGTVLVEKAQSSLRVINDLNAMADAGTFNTALRDLMGQTEKATGFHTTLYKSRLNADQRHAVANAFEYTNSVIVGPPGTGKSYTITTIIAEAVVKNQSVLVVSKTKQAVEVLRKMLQDDFKLKDYLVHTTGSHYKVSLKAKIKRFLSGVQPRTKSHLDESRIARLFERLEILERKFERLVERELERSDLNFAHQLTWPEKWKRFYLNALVFDDTKLWTLFQELEENLRQLDKEISTYSKRKIQRTIERNSEKHRQDIAYLFHALEAESFTKYKAILSRVNHKNILKVFPVWLANLADLNSAVQMQPDVFDLVIIDEATQCDIASALPAIYRAKRAVVAGDPYQLKHYSFVSRAAQRDLRAAHKLADDPIFDYRDRSILDVFIANMREQRQVSFLREHFRSSPSLIEFSNRQFYDGQLQVLKATPKHTSHRQIELIEIEGSRDKKGVNEQEAHAIIEKVKELFSQFSAQKNVPSIGIVALFQAQAVYINQLLRQHFSLKELKQFNIRCGTPYQFQGDEREIIFMSFTVCDDTHPSAFIHANKPEVVNVAITRAKSYQYVYKSVADAQLNKDSLLFQYVQFIREFSHTEQHESDLDAFQQDVIAALQKGKYDAVLHGYPLAGILLDILVFHNGKSFFIDLIGYPGRFKEALTLERYKTLARTGVAVLPLHYSYWKKHPKNAAKRLHDFIKRKG